MNRGQRRGRQGCLRQGPGQTCLSEQILRQSVRGSGMKWNCQDRVNFREEVRPQESAQGGKSLANSFPQMFEKRPPNLVDPPPLVLVTTCQHPPDQSSFHSSFTGVCPLSRSPALLTMCFWGGKTKCFHILCLILTNQ